MSGNLQTMSTHINTEQLLPVDANSSMVQRV